MADTWTPVFDLPTPEKVAVCTKTTETAIADIIAGVQRRARKCPVQAIRMENGRPVWVQAQCVLCLGCLHRCPRFAIQYGKHTKQHGQYTNPNVHL